MLDLDILDACRTAYVDGRPEISATVWEQIRTPWLGAYRAAADHQADAEPAEAVMPRAA